MIPFSPFAADTEDGDDDEGDRYTTPTYWYSLVSGYAGIPLTDVLHLDYIDYLVLRRDAYILRLRATERGRKYLLKCWQLEQTKPDRGALRSAFGSKEVR